MGIVSDTTSIDKILINLDFVEKKIFLDFYIETVKRCHVKAYKSNYHWKVDVPATPTQ